MLINLSQPRKDYFKRWDARRILLQFLDKKRIVPKDLLEVDIIVGTKEENLEQLLDGKSYQLDNQALVDKIKSLERDRLLILPAAYRIPAGESRELICYEMDSMVNLDKVMIRRALLDNNDPGRRLTVRQKEELNWHPEDVISTAFKYLNQHKDKYIDRKFIGYCWTGADKSLRVVPIMNNIKGAELRAFQNLAYYQLGIPRLEMEVESGINSATGEEFTRKELEKKRRKLSKYQAHLKSQRTEGKELSHYVAQLQVRQRDLIEPNKRGFKHSMGRNFIVPSKTNIYKEYNVKIVNIPMFEEEDPRIVSTVWDMFGECYCKDKNYRSDRKDTKLKEYYFCPHEIASLHGLKAMMEQEWEKRRIHSLPFLVPSKGMVDYVDKLRYRTVMLEKNPETDNMRIRALNDTEIGRLVMMKMIADPYEKNGVTDSKIFTRMKYDPHTGLVKFRE
ncbi:MAG: hypothetical protein ABH824_05130 [Nanoarchaeota archaeon]|nr:hypothetical protein [Nanoarchaeota archaeon]MBU1632832.1 hypothetical protein [Nanoarchaeota archaeon]MBU1876475.1 hypothetical protein [Nanoarchaeota archaeon]